MNPDFHARPTAPVPPTPEALKLARLQPQRVAKPFDAPAPSPRPAQPQPLPQPQGRAPVAVPAIAPAAMVQVPAPVAQVPAPQAPARPAFPRLRFSAVDVFPKSLVARGTKLWTIVGVIGGLAALLGAIGGTMGLALLGLILAPILDRLREKKARALLEGTALRVSEAQLPELHSCAVEFAGRLGLKDVPAMYIVEDNVVNGFAANIGRKDVVLLTDDLVWGALSAKNPRALGFVLGHEMAHIALGHTGTFRSIMRTVVKPLGRLDELSADNVARALVDDDTVAFEGIKLLAVGPQLSAYVDDDALIAQANEVIANKRTKKLEKKMSHPMIMRRVANLLE